MTSKKKNKRKLTFLNRLIYLLNMLAVIALIASYLSVYLPPDQIWWPSVFGLVFPYIALVNLVFMFYWMIIGKRQFLLSLIFLLFGWNQIRNYYQFKGHKDDIKGKSSFNLLSFNTHNLSDNNAGVINPETRKQIFDFVKGESPDIICLQEFYTRVDEKEKLINDFSKWVNRPEYHSDVYFKGKTRRTNSLITLSQWPMVDQGTLRHTNKKAYAIYTDIAIPGIDTVRIYNIHLQSVHLLRSDIDFVNDLGFQQNTDDLKSGTKELLWKLRKAFSSRTQQVRNLEEHIKQSPWPVILCGDFNDTPTSYVYHRLKRKRKDAFREDGKGVGFTYAGKLPIPLRLDYILYDPSFTSKNFKIHRINLSDHFPITANISSREEQ